MTEQTARAASTRAPLVAGRRARSWSRRQWRRAIGIGCLPLTFLLAVSLVALFSLLLFAAAPPWISDPRTYVIAGRLSVAIAILFVLQIVYHWINGLLAANAGAVAARGQGGTLRLRLRIVRRRFLVPTLATVLLRLGAILVVALTLIYAFTRVLGSPIDLSLPAWMDSRRNEALFAGLTLGIIALYWLINPFLRLGFSTALGALAGTWSHRADERTSLALSARLGIGLIGVLAILWGGAALYLIMLALSNPISRYIYSPYRSYGVLNTVHFSIAALLIVGMLLAGQILLAGIFTRLAQRRLAHRTPLRKKKLAAQRVRSEPEDVS